MSEYHIEYVSGYGLVIREKTTGKVIVSSHTLKGKDMEDLCEALNYSYVAGYREGGKYAIKELERQLEQLKTSHYMQGYREGFAECKELSKEKF